MPFLVRGAAKGPRHLRGCRGRVASRETVTNHPGGLPRARRRRRRFHALELSRSIDVGPVGTTRARRRARWSATRRRFRRRFTSSDRSGLEAPNPRAPPRCSSRIVPRPLELELSTAAPVFSTRRWWASTHLEHSGHVHPSTSRPVYVQPFRRRARRPPGHRSTTQQHAPQQPCPPLVIVPGVTTSPAGGSEARPRRRRARARLDARGPFGSGTPRRPRDRSRPGPRRSSRGRTFPTVLELATLTARGRRVGALPSPRCRTSSTPWAYSSIASPR